MNMESIEKIMDESKQGQALVLKNKEGNTKLLKKESVTSETLGGEFELISKLERDSYRIPNGIKVSNVSTGKLRQMGIDNGFIFVKVNGKPADDVYDLIQLLETVKGQVRVEGVTSNGTSQYLSFTFR